MLQEVVSGASTGDIDLMTGQLLLAAALVLVAYTVGYVLGRDDERRSNRRRQMQIGRARDREWQQTIGVPGSPKMN